MKNQNQKSNKLVYPVIILLLLGVYFVFGRSKTANLYNKTMENNETITTVMDKTQGNTQVNPAVTTMPKVMVTVAPASLQNDLKSLDQNIDSIGDEFASPDTELGI